MNINDYVEDCLRFFAEEARILNDVLFIGAWARYFYQERFDASSGYRARMMTKDLDILVPRAMVKAARKIDVHARLIAAEFEPLFARNGLVKYARDALEVEFLLPARGSPSAEPVKINAYNVNAQELAHLNMLFPGACRIAYGKYRVQVPDPINYALHKLIISARRAKRMSAEQDRQDAEEVMFPLTQEKGFAELFAERLSKLSNKQFAAVVAGLNAFTLPRLRDQLTALAENKT